jgi:Domain of unknown function (DUF4203)
MVTDSFFALLCAGLIGTLLGLFLTFAGYRFFLFLLPLWGFFFGLAFGAQTMQALFGVGFLATISSWVVGFVVGAIFAVLSYLFYIVAVILIAGFLGYAIGAGVMLAILPQMNFLAWLVGVVVAVILALVTLRFNLQKYVIIIATSLLGAGAVFGTFLFMFYPAAQLLANPVKVMLQSNWLLMLLFLVLAICGIVFQIRVNRNYEVETYNRFAEPSM